MHDKDDVPTSIDKRLNNTPNCSGILRQQCIFVFCGVGDGWKGNGVIFVALFCEYRCHIVKRVVRVPDIGSEHDSWLGHFVFSALPPNMDVYVREYYKGAESGVYPRDIYIRGAKEAERPSQRKQ